MSVTFNTVYTFSFSTLPLPHASAPPFLMRFTPLAGAKAWRFLELYLRIYKVNQFQQNALNVNGMHFHVRQQTRLRRGKNISTAAVWLVSNGHKQQSLGNLLYRGTFSNRGLSESRMCNELSV